MAMTMKADPDKPAGDEVNTDVRRDQRRAAHGGVVAGGPRTPAGHDRFGELEDRRRAEFDATLARASVMAWAVPVPSPYWLASRDGFSRGAAGCWKRFRRATGDGRRFRAVPAAGGAVQSRPRGPLGASRWCRYGRM